MKIIYNSQEREISKNTSIKEAFKEEIEKSEIPIIGAKYNNEYKRLDYVLEEDGAVSLVNIATQGGMKIYRRTLIYIMAKAFDKLYKEAKIRVNYQLAYSMFCSIDNMEVTTEILTNVENEMRKIIAENLPIIQKKLTRKEAEELYAKEDSSRGRLQLDLENNEDINMYYCEDYYNYIYEDIAISTGITKIFDLVQYDDGFLLRYPSSSNPNTLPPYQETKKLHWALDEYNDIHKILDVTTIYKLNNIIKHGNIKNLIMLEEALHEKKIAQIADKIAERKNVKMVLIAGPSSSGKTTFAKRLGVELRLNGLKPVTISVDNYFVERVDNPKDENGDYDFECLEAIDLELFNNHIKTLLDGGTIDVPTFDFKVGTKRYNGEKMHLADDEILVIEGIHCLNDKLTSSIPREQKYKIYISDLTVLNIDYCNRISTTDTRLIRRIVRDNNFRGYSALHTLRTWASVNRGENKNIFPYQENCDVMFNSSLIYELSVLKKQALPLLQEITNAEPEYAEAKRLVEFLKYFEEVDEGLIPQNSLLREFVGGSIFGD